MRSSHNEVVDSLIIVDKTQLRVSFLGSVGRASVSYAVVNLDSRGHLKVASSSLAGSNFLVWRARSFRETVNYSDPVLISSSAPVCHQCNPRCYASPVLAGVACHICIG